MLKKNRFSQRRQRENASEDVNPMNYLSNLSDVMLVLAVGMMLALVAAWKVDIGGAASQQDSTALKGEVELVNEPENLYQTNDQEGDSLENFGLTEYGMVYVDENGNYYVIDEGE